MTRLLNLSTVDIFGCITPCVRGVLGIAGYSAPSLAYAQKMSVVLSTPTIKTAKTKSLKIARCPVEGKSPLVENCWFTGRCFPGIT